MATRELATWISALRFQDLPESVLRAAVRSFQNSIGCIIGGSTHQTTQRAIDAFALDGGSSKNCTCLGQSHRGHQSTKRLKSDSTLTSKSLHTDASSAALINGIASHVHDYDDTHLYTVIHPAGAIVVGLLATIEERQQLVQSHTSGEEFLTALVVGIETSLRLGNAISPNHYSAGWHITGTVSPLGVAAALCNLLQLDANTTVNALGIASAQPIGIRVHFGTDTKPFHAGRAAQVGIQAVQLAQAGFTAAPDSLEGKRGWVEVLGHGANSLDEQLSQLLSLTESAKTGQHTGPWEIEKNTFKPFPCGIVIHPTIDACIQLHEELNLQNTESIAQVDSIQLKVHHLVLDLTGKKAPRDGLEAKFSVYHGAAIGLVLGSATPAEYSDDIVIDTRITNVRDKVTAEVDENIRSDEAVVTITMSDGSERMKHVEHAVGSLDRPMTDEELKDKFLKQVEPVLGRERAVEVDRLAWGVLGLEDVTEIIKAAA